MNILDDDGAFDKYEGFGDEDSDGVKDFRDFHQSKVDTDMDGLSDNLEKSLGTNFTDADSDHDGINDYIETNKGKRIDTDHDGFYFLSIGI